MKKYEYMRIRRLAEELKAAGIRRAIIDKIMEGGSTIRGSTPGEKKADWMREAMLRMDKLLDRKTRQAVRGGCACCLGGIREKIVKKIAKQYDTLDDRIKAANNAKLVFGHGVVLQDDGKLRVSFSPEGLKSYRCVCLPKVEEPISITYCYCCGGHVKHHLQIALGRKLVCKAHSSALSSGGKKPCTFIFSLEQ